WKKRLVRAKNSFLSGVYPASPSSWMVVVLATAGSCYCQVDPSLGLIARIQHCLPRGEALGPEARAVVSTVLFSTGAWLAAVLLFRRVLRLLLSYHGWMFEPHGRMSRSTRLWIVMSIRKPLLYSFQSSLPKLPVPPVKATIARYLESVRPLLDDDKYAEMAALAKEFQEKTAPRLQRYLRLKAWWTTNYVSWWIWGIPGVGGSHGTGGLGDPRGTEGFGGMMALGVVPMCSYQSERMFNTTRIPGKETDTLLHLADSKHLAVYHKGRYYKVWLYYGGQLLAPADLEMQFQRILEDPSPPQPGEERLAALTAGDRWAGKGDNGNGGGDNGNNGNDGNAQGLRNWGAEGPGWNWGSGGVLEFGAGGFGGPGVIAPLNPNVPMSPQFMLATDTFQLGYTEGGHCKGDPKRHLAPPQRLQWNIPPEGVAAIESSLRVARALAEDVDFCCFPFSTFGKGLIKRCRTSPDAFIQIALQLAHFRDKGSFCLTYEASMTRLFREGRTETVRSCTAESTAFVRSMMSPSLTDVPIPHGCPHPLWMSPSIVDVPIPYGCPCLSQLSPSLMDVSPSLTDVPIPCGCPHPSRLSPSLTDVPTFHKSSHVS
uniref:Carnitine palmitoyltransferase 1B n=1 Tax=Zosterops lateralis melanops TaxID=1220523 RepID=A0A8D2QQ82_ZOSLA